MTDRNGLKYNVHLQKVDSVRLTWWLCDKISFLNREEIVDLIYLVMNKCKLEIRRKCLTFGGLAYPSYVHGKGKQICYEVALR